MDYRSPVSEASLWIFGYGSLVWRPDFPHRRSCPGLVRGWTRRFWQGSTDHRGLPESPGRVVTLLGQDDPDLVREAALPGSTASPRADPEACWGRAYEVSAEQRDEVLANLDHRERGGYSRVEIEIEIFPDGRSPSATSSTSFAGEEKETKETKNGLLYIASQTNPNYLGPASIDAIADQVARAIGPSGPNPEYVFELAQSLRRMQARDAHVFALEQALRDRLGASERAR